MTKKKALILFICIAFAGSFICFYSTNLLASDLGNMFYMTVTRDVISSLPLTFVSFDFILAAIAVLRFVRHPEYRKAQSELYSRILLAFSVCGIISGILTGTIVYGSFTVPYPFKYAVIITMIWHILVLFCSLRCIKASAKLPDDKTHRRMKLGYALYTVFFFAVCYFSFNRFGAFLWSPVYVHRRSFDLTWSFYLSLILPMALLLHIALYSFGQFEKHKKAAVVYAASVLVISVLMFYVIMCISMKNTLFVSVVSPAVGIERLATKPIDTIVHFVLSIVFSMVNLIYSIKRSL